MKNPRNAGRKTIPNGIKKHVIIPAEFEKEFKEFVKELQNRVLKQKL